MKQSSNKIGIIGNIMLISCTPWYDTMRRVIHLCSIFFTNPLWEKISKLKLRNILQHIWQLLSQNVKVIGNNERQKKIISYVVKESDSEICLYFAIYSKYFWNSCRRSNESSNVEWEMWEHSFVKTLHFSSFIANRKGDCCAFY